MADRETHVANFFETELTTELGPTDLVAEVASTGGLQSPAFLVIEPDNPNQREVILFDGAFTDTEFRATSIANRYLGGSAQPGGLTHPVGSVVRSAPLAQHIQDLNDRIDAVEEATVDTAKIADGAVTAAKIAGNAISAFERSGATVQTNVPVPDPVGTLAIVTLNIPSSWSSWDCVAFAHATAQPVSGNPGDIGLLVQIDGTDGPGFRYHISYTPVSVAVTAASFRSGITTTGNSTIRLQGWRYSTPAVDLPTVFLYARAFRTS